MSETKSVGLKMARADQDDIDRVVKFFQFIEEYMEYGTHTPDSEEFEEDSIDLTDEAFVEKLRELWGGRFVQRPGVDSAWSRVVYGFQTLVTNVCDPEKDYLDLKPEIAVQLVSPEKLDEIVGYMNGDPNHFRQILCDKNELLARACDYADRLADRKQTEPWVIFKNIFGHGSGVSSAIFQLYRREDSE